MSSTPVRIGLDYRPALLTSAGIGRAVRELSRALANLEGIDLRLFGHSFARARRSDPTPPEARLHRLPIPGRSLPALATVGLDAGRLCGGTTLFHWTDYVHPPVTSARTILTIHDLAFTADPTFHGGQSQLLLSRCRAAAERSERIICPSRATADAVRSELGIDGDRVRVIPFGCDHIAGERIAEPPVPGPFLLAIGTVEPRKNHLGLLDAWRRLPAPRPGLCVLGRRGWECDEIVTALESAVRDEAVVWIERPDDATVFRFLRHATALVYPSRLEGFGFPPLEAMRCGTPVLAGDTPALREVLDDAAVFCDPHDSADLAARLDEIVRDEGLRSRLVEGGRKRARGFTWEHCAKLHLDVYREILREEVTRRVGR